MPPPCLPVMSARVMAPVGQISTQVPHSMQTLEAMWKGGLTRFSLPRLTRLMACTPTISSQARTHRPHRMQVSGSVV